MATVDVTVTPTSTVNVHTTEPKMLGPSLRKAVRACLIIVPLAPSIQLTARKCLVTAVGQICRHHIPKSFRLLAARKMSRTSCKYQSRPLCGISQRSAKSSIVGPVWWLMCSTALLWLVVCHLRS